MRIVLVLGILVGAAGCDDPCGNTILESLESPDGKRVAVLFTRDCGATTSMSTQLSILDAEERLKGSGTTFIADDDHGKAPSNRLGVITVMMNWISSRELAVSYPS